MMLLISLIGHRNKLPLVNGGSRLGSELLLNLKPSSGERSENWIPIKLSHSSADQGTTLLLLTLQNPGPGWSNYNVGSRKPQPDERCPSGGRRITSYVRVARLAFLFYRWSSSSALGRASRNCRC